MLALDAQREIADRGDDRLQESDRHLVADLEIVLIGQRLRDEMD